MHFIGCLFIVQSRFLLRTTPQKPRGCVLLATQYWLHDKRRQVTAITLKYVHEKVNAAPCQSAGGAVCRQHSVVCGQCCHCVDCRCIIDRCVRFSKWCPYCGMFTNSYKNVKLFPFTLSIDRLSDSVCEINNHTWWLSYYYQQSVCNVRLYVQWNWFL